MNVVKVLEKHPGLILYMPRGQVELRRRHLEIELKHAQMLWKEYSNADWHRLGKMFKRNLCIRTGILYFLVRNFRPKVVVETGVKYGYSSAFILQALEDNGEGGRLYSIDLPSAEYRREDTGQVHSDALKGGALTGCAVPLELKSQWSLILGDARVELPNLVKKLDHVDFFYHDSLHTKEHMMFEMEAVWPKLSTQGIIACDDVDWNDAFSEFCAGKKLEPKLARGVGYTIKLPPYVESV